MWIDLPAGGDLLNSILAMLNTTVSSLDPVEKQTMILSAIHAASHALLKAILVNVLCDPSDVRYENSKKSLTKITIKYLPIF